MEQVRYFEDYAIGDGRKTMGRTITETDFVVHAGHTGDFFPHHMDAEFMKTQPFGQRIAHGTMVFSIGVGLTASIINPVAFSYGYDRMRFIKPVFPVIANEILWAIGVSLYTFFYGKQGVTPRLAHAAAPLRSASRAIASASTSAST